MLARKASTPLFHSFGTLRSRFSLPSDSQSRSAVSFSTATIEVGKDTVKPKIKRFKISPTEISGKGKAAFALRYSDDDKAKIKIERRTSCHGKGCKKYAKVGTRRAKRFVTEDKLALKLGLDPGSYRATAIATDPAGNRSKSKRLQFSVR